MSVTRPPITAGPIERAFRFLKSVSVSGGATGEEVAVAEGDAIGDATVVGEGEGVSSADKEWKNRDAKTQKTKARVPHEVLSSRFMVVGQAPRLSGQAEGLPYN